MTDTGATTTGRDPWTSDPGRNPPECVSDVGFGVRVYTGSVLVDCVSGPSSTSCLTLGPWTDLTEPRHMGSWSVGGGCKGFGDLPRAKGLRDRTFVVGVCRSRSRRPVSRPVPAFDVDW